jgi:transposase-like protein
MTAKVKAKSNGVASKILKQPVKTSIPAYTKLLRLIVDLADAGENTTRGEGVELLERASEWLMKYCGLTEEALEEYDLDQLVFLLQEAEGAFNTTRIPQTKSAT